MDPIDTTFCNYCHEEKLVEEFSWNNKVKGILSTCCKDCMAVSTKKWRQANPEKVLARRRKWNAENPEKVAASAKKWAKGNSGKAKKWQQANPEKVAINSKKWQQANPEKVAINSKKWKQNHRLEYNQYQIDRRNDNVLVQIAHSLRCRLNNAIKNGQKSGSAVDDLGCSIPELKQYLESQFQLGMTWENRGFGAGKWQIDHVDPLCNFDLSNREEFLKAFHYTNLQPLWHEDHARKTASDILKKVDR
jgi:hypothetical protein